MSILDIIFNSQNESILNSIVLFTAILASLISVSGYFYERSKKKRKEEKDEIIKVINQTRSELCKQMTDQREMLTGMIRNKEKFVNLQIDNLVDAIDRHADDIQRIEATIFFRYQDPDNDRNYNKSLTKRKRRNINDKGVISSEDEDTTS